LLHTTEHMFQQLLETDTPEPLRSWLNVTAFSFWDYHYTLKEKAPPRPKHLGEQFTDNIMLNTIIPVLFAYGCWKGEQQYKDRAIQWLQHLPAEQNAVLNKFRLMGATTVSAFESQALLELKTQYCDRKRCLDCAIGNSLISLQWPSS
ncbi:MAG: DUF2851 family protein, partial [Pseudobacter sp.]|uniref:DUF2851 family protein n=1 Tax=Pseudobacter sp. TaxID=2045420 RepID=UPI003F7D1938